MKRDKILSQAKKIFGRAMLPVWLSLCLIFGGASSAGYMANGFLQTLGIAIIFITGWRYMTTNVGQREWTEIGFYEGRPARSMLFLAAAIAVWIVIQMVPLPAAIWHNLGGRNIIIAGDRLMGLAGISRPMSMQPNSTLISGMWLIVPVATFLITLNLNEPARKYGGYAVVVIAILSSALGVVQIGQGENSRAYFYDITNFGTSVGFFANSNHLATLFLCALAMCPWLFFEHDERRRGRRSRALNTIGIATAAILVLNIAINRSVAGYILVIPVIAFVMLQHEAGRQAVARLPISMRSFLLALTALTILVGWLMFDVLRDFSVGLTDPDTRIAYYSQSLAIARQSFPFGTGLGTFRWIFTGYEDPSAVDQTFVNHVHNDYIELLLEGGVVSIILIVVFAIWMVRRVRQIGSLADFQKPLQWTSIVVVAVIAGHSFVDYPARTAAIAAIAAFAIANLAAPASRR